MIKQITSKDNLLIKKIRQLESKKFRDKYNEFLVEGEQLLNEAIQSGGLIHTVIYSDGFLADAENEEMMAYLLERKIPLYCVEDKLFSFLSDTQTPQGIIAIVEKPQWEAKELLKENKHENILVLDRIQDPGNLGTMIRSAEAAGYGLIAIMKGTTDPYSSKVVRSACGGVLRMPMIYFENPAQAITTLKDAKKKLLCTDPKGKSAYYDKDLRQDMALIIGNEAGGVCQEFMKGCDYSVTIPMLGKTESLNAAVAASILMYETLRQNLRGEK